MRIRIRLEVRLSTPQKNLIKLLSCFKSPAGSCDVGFDPKEIEDKEPFNCEASNQEIKTNC